MASTESTPGDAPTCIPCLFLFFGLQLAALGMAVARFDWIVDQVEPSQRWALHLVLFAQILGGAMLLPVWRSRWRTTLLAIAVCWPMLQLAGILAGFDQTTLLAVSFWVTLWLIGLSFWRHGLPAHAQWYVVVLYVAWSLGGIALTYVYAEFNAPPGQRAFPGHPLSSPLLMAAGLLENPGLVVAWVAVGIHLFLALSMAATHLYLLSSAGEKQNQVDDK